MDPSQSPVGKLRGDLQAMWNRGIDPMQVEQQYQAGLSQVKYAAEKPAGMDAISERYGSYGNNIPSMRNNLMKLSQPKLQQPRFALPNSRAQY